MNPIAICYHDLQYLPCYYCRQNSPLIMYAVRATNCNKLACSSCIDIGQQMYECYIDTNWSSNFTFYKMIITEIRMAKSYLYNEWTPTDIQSIIRDNLFKHKL